MQEIRRQAELTHRQASPIFCYLEFRGKVKKSGKEKGSTKNGWGKRGGRRQQRVIEGVNMIEVPYLHIQKVTMKSLILFN